VRSRLGAAGLVDADDLERAVRSASLPASDKVTADAAETVDRNLDLVRGDNGVVDGSLRVVIDTMMKDGSVSCHIFTKKNGVLSYECLAPKARTRRECGIFLLFFSSHPPKEPTEGTISTRFLLPFSGSISLALSFSLTLSSFADEERPRVL
jgi:hypothetical protein